MDLDTCFNYLNFIAKECQKHLDDGHISDDELISLIVEFELFQKKCLGSNIPESIKTQLKKLKLNYSIRSVERSDKLLIIAFLTLGIWAIFIYFRKDWKRKQTLKRLKSDATNLAYFIRLNF